MWGTLLLLFVLGLEVILWGFFLGHRVPCVCPEFQRQGRKDCSRKFYPERVTLLYDKPLWKCVLHKDIHKIIRKSPVWKSDRSWCSWDWMEINQRTDKRGEIRPRFPLHSYKITTWEHSYAWSVTIISFHSLSVNINCIGFPRFHRPNFSN